jgi:hypothetical protein
MRRVRERQASVSRPAKRPADLPGGAFLSIVGNTGEINPGRAGEKELRSG